MAIRYGGVTIAGRNRGWIGRCCCCRQHLGALASIVLPMENDLIVYEFGALRRCQLSTEVFVLEQIEKMQTHRKSARRTEKNQQKAGKNRIILLDKLGIFRPFPVEQIFQVVDESLVLEVASLSKNWKEEKK